MKNVYFTFVIILLTLSLLMSKNNILAKEGKTLSLEIKSDKEIYSVGDFINIDYILKNTGNEDLRVAIAGLYEFNWIEIYSLDDNQKMVGIPKIEFSIKVHPDKNDFVLLGPMQSHTINVKGKIKKGRIKENDKGVKLFIDFDFSRILLKEKVIDYLIKGKCRSNEVWRKYGIEKIGFTNIWSGEIESNEVKIKIIEFRGHNT